MTEFEQFVENKDLTPEHAQILHESSQRNRYSIEVNYRTEIDEVMDAFAKLCLGYVSAGLKAVDYHCKTLFNTKPYRCLVSTRNWDDGEWVALVVWNHENHYFVIGTGSYNRDRKTVTIETTKKVAHKSSSDIVKEMKNILEKLKKEDPIRRDSLRRPNLKRGPKAKSLVKPKKYKFKTI